MADLWSVSAHEPQLHADWSPPTITITRDSHNDEIVITATPTLADRRMFDAASVRVHLTPPALTMLLANAYRVMSDADRAAFNQHLTMMGPIS